jgi:hypothetical protein
MEIVRRINVTEDIRAELVRELKLALNQELNGRTTSVHHDRVIALIHERDRAIEACAAQNYQI